MNHARAFEPEEFKDSTRRQWDAAAKGWNDWTPQLRAWLTDATRAMLDMAGVRGGGRVLDVAAGAGDQTLDIAARVGPDGYVLATDISPGIVALAAENARRANFANVEARVADGEKLVVEEAGFDAAVCRLGLMFFPDPVLGLQAMFRALKPGGRACTMVFSVPDKNPCLVIPMSVARKHAGLPPPSDQRGGLLSLGKPGLIDGLFQQAGFDQVESRTTTAVFRLTSAKDYVAFMRASAGPIHQIMTNATVAAQDAAWSEMEAKLVAFETGQGFAGPFELLLTSGRHPT